ncbi:hypothetical protein [Acaryochloris marina]|uniref:hypothetical protein n=1 Tax=Acaryochloris marina TaxID=155978 RepID=UPI001BB0676C|nr:hypothetical protein [Acaryochloris marina]QUY44840.1 hypothetical protein I1H34_12610 [Acaryochloris marina S15]
MTTEKKLKNSFLAKIFIQKHNFRSDNLNRPLNYFNKVESSYLSNKSNSINNKNLDISWLEIDFDNTDLEEGGRI